jgi:hypothetical protein
VYQMAEPCILSETRVSCQLLIFAILLIQCSECYRISMLTSSPLSGSIRPYTTLVFFLLVRHERSRLRIKLLAWTASGICMLVVALAAL